MADQRLPDNDAATWTFYVCSVCNLAKMDEAPMVMHSARCGGGFLPVEVVPLSVAQNLATAAQAVAKAHRAVIEAVTPGHPNWCADNGEEYSARFSAWHATTRELRDALAEFRALYPREETTG